MAEHPILFRGDMIRALLNTRIGEPGLIDPAKPYKSQTRRMSRQWLKVRAGDYLWVRETWASPEADKSKPGRIAYDADGVCGCWTGSGEDRRFIYHGRILEASGYCECFPQGGASTFGLGKYSDIRRGEYPSYRHGWRPSIFMPRWASRIRLQATEDARLERLQDITEEDARLEGVDAERWVRIGGDGGVSYRLGFRSIWHSLHTKPGERWEDNPELVRLAFRRVL